MALGNVIIFYKRTIYITGTIPPQLEHVILTPDSLWQALMIILSSGRDNLVTKYNLHNAYMALPS